MCSQLYANIKKNVIEFVPIQYNKREKEEALLAMLSLW